MKILAVGDPHAKHDNYEDIVQLTSEIIRVNNEHKPDAIIILGDLSHSHDKLSVYAHKSIMYLFTELKKVNDNVAYLIGNHDLVNNNEYLSDRHFFAPFRAMGIQIIDKPVIFGNYIACPYVYPGRFEEALSSIPDWENYTAIFAHQEFRGVSFNAGHISEIGDIYEEGLPLVVSGHIHSTQWLQNNIYYVGSSTQTNFGEKPQKYLAIVEGKKVLQVPIEVPVKYTIETNMGGILDEIANPKPSLHKVRYSVSCSMAEMQAFKKTNDYEKLQKLGKVIFKITDTIVRVSQKDKPKSFSEILKEKAAACGSDVISFIRKVL